MIDRARVRELAAHEIQPAGELATDLDRAVSRLESALGGRDRVELMQAAGEVRDLAEVYLRVHLKRMAGDRKRSIESTFGRMRRLCVAFATLARVDLRPDPPPGWPEYIEHIRGVLAEMNAVLAPKNRGSERLPL